MMNSVQVIGRITADPEVKVTSGGVSVLSFSLAVNRNYKNKSGEYDTDFFRCVAYRGTADLIGKYAKKGDLLGLTGVLRQNSYEKDGRKYSVVEIYVETAQFLTAKKKAKAVSDDLDEIEPMDNLPF